MGDNDAAGNFGGEIINGVSIVKIGAGQQILSGSNSYTGSTTVNNGTLQVSGSLADTALVAVAGGTLSLAAPNLINPAATVTSGGGTFLTTGNETLAAFTLNGTAAIDLGSLPAILQFGNSSAQTWNGMLSILDWNGSAGGGGTDQVLFGTNASGLTAGELADVVFVNPANFTSGTYNAGMTSTGEVVPTTVFVPEPDSTTLLCFVCPPCVPCTTLRGGRGFGASKYPAR